MRTDVVISCEHATAKVPSWLKYYFLKHTKLLASHRGWDPGAIVMARSFASTCRCPLVTADVSRLVIDTNRSINSKSLFTTISKTFTQKEKKIILKQFYYPYRNRVENNIRDAVKTTGHALHLSVHSFTPALNGEVRTCDIGILYNPASSAEKQFARTWAAQIKKHAPYLCIRFNYPYRGTSDGFTTALRKQFSAQSYVGFELELNQKLFSKKQVLPKAVSKALVESFYNTIAEL